MLFFAFCQADVHFDFAAVIVQVERDDGVTRAFGFADEFVDFRTVQQQFALADRIGFDVCGSGRQRGNVAAYQIESIFFPMDIAFFKLHAARAYGFDFPAFQNEAGFELVFDEKVVEGLFIVGNTHKSDSSDFFQTAYFIRPSEKLKRVNQAETRQRFAVDFNRFRKHGGGARPQAVIAVKGAVDNQFFFGFTVFRRTDDFVEAAFEMAVDTGFNRCFHFGCVLVTAVDTFDGFGAVRFACRRRSGRWVCQSRQESVRHQQTIKKWRDSENPP